MRLRLSSLCLLLCVACASGGTQPAGAPTPTPSPSIQPSPTSTQVGDPEPDAAPALPDPDRRVPTKPRKLADELLSNDKLLKTDTESWLDAGGRLGTKNAHRVSLRALWQQRMYRVLAAKEGLYRKVLRRVPGWFGHVLEVHVDAGSKLRALVTNPLTPRKARMFKTSRPTAPSKLLGFYKKGQRRSGIPWSTLASLNFVESKFGRILGPSSAGAQGPMQFIPSTWDAYGNGGDINDPHDSILAAARYLRASGAPSRMRSALYAYNHSTAYVDAVQTYARRIRKDKRSYYAYYFWQVFVVTTKGDLQLTGPGNDR